MLAALAESVALSATVNLKSFIPFDQSSGYPLIHHSWLVNHNRVRKYRSPRKYRSQSLVFSLAWEVCLILIYLYSQSQSEMDHSEHQNQERTDITLWVDLTYPVSLKLPPTCLDLRAASSASAWGIFVEDPLFGVVESHYHCDSHPTIFLGPHTCTIESSLGLIENSVRPSFGNIKLKQTFVRIYSSTFT